MTRREATAMHEAAHAVVALLHPDARDPVLVELLNDHGRTVPDPSVDATMLSDAQLLGECTVAFAGNWAEFLFCIEQADFETFKQGDLQIAANLVRANGRSEDDVTRILHRADKQEAEQWVRANEAAIRRVAALLLERRSLRGADIQAAV